MEWIRRNRNVAAALVLIALVWAAFGGALRCGFVYFDDDTYVFENAEIAQGWTFAGVRWAFTTGYAANWHPLTWLSHMTDIELFGLDPKAHHAVNVWIHVLNALLLFGVLRKSTGRWGLSWWVAALWCVHPLRAESVVWVSERKDVLAAFFGLATLWVHVRERGLHGGRRQALAAACFALSLMSKPAWVTMPFLLLVVDFWPLDRWRKGGLGALWREKWALFALSALSCVVTFVVQQRGGAVGSLELLPPGTRLANATAAYAEYIRLLFWPSGLTVLYPYPAAGYSALRVAASLALGLAISAVALRNFRRQPWLAAGWLWYLGTLVPMIGLVQVGRQSWADRYSYLPHIGLITALAWGAAAALDRWGGELPRGVRHEKQTGVSGRRPRLETVSAALACVLVLGLLPLSRRQTEVWRTNESLFLHALAATKDNTLAHGNLGTFYGKQGRWGPAEFHLGEVLRINPMDGGARYSLGNVYFRQGRRADAVAQYRLAVQDPKQWEAMNDLAWLLATAPDGSAHSQEALQWAERAAQEAPPGKRAETGDTLSVARANAGDFPGAIGAAEEARAAAAAAGDFGMAAQISRRLEGYRQGRAWRP